MADWPSAFSSATTSLPRSDCASASEKSRPTVSGPHVESTFNCSAVSGFLQTLAALVFGLFTRWFRAEGLLPGWAAGIIWGSGAAWDNGLKTPATFALGRPRP